MISTPSRPTEKYILGRLYFHETQAEWFSDHGQDALAVWAASCVDMWRGRLEALRGTPEVKSKEGHSR